LTFALSTIYVNQRTGEEIIPQTRTDDVPEDMRRRG
jgi:hypothetical protein